MARHVFYSFYYKPDCWRIQQVRNIGTIEGQRMLHANEWESIERSAGGVKRWIDNEMQGKSCVVVLIGSETATRPWVDYEICKGWNEGKGVLGVHIHNLEDQYNRTCPKGTNPFHSISLKNGRRLSEHVPVFDPPGWNGKQVYASIEANLPALVDQAIAIRNAARAA